MLGPLEVRTATGAVVDLGTPKQRAHIGALVAPGYRLAVERGDVDAVRFADTVTRIAGELDRVRSLTAAQLAALTDELVRHRRCGAVTPTSTCQTDRGSPPNEPDWPSGE